MRDTHTTVRIATYNIHKCRGMDRRVRPDRIVKVLREVQADIIALQEVVSLEGGAPEEDQARYVADALGFHFAFGQNRFHRGGRYGNVVLARFPIHSHINYDISATGGRESRGCLRTDVTLNGVILHVFNVHFGTRVFEQRSQARQLFDQNIVTHRELSGHRIVLGDFNEWLRGSVISTLGTHFDRPSVHSQLRRSRTFPGTLPIFRLDQIYYDRPLRLQRVHRHRTRTAIIASDHLPLVAELAVPGSSSSPN